jgi:hypothetical protein
MEYFHECRYGKRYADDNIQRSGDTCIENGVKDVGL